MRWKTRLYWSSPRAVTLWCERARRRNLKDNPRVYRRARLLRAIGFMKKWREE